MLLNIADLIKAIDKATETVEVKVDSTDYYRRPGDLETRYLAIVDPDKLKEALKALED